MSKELELLRKMIFASSMGDLVDAALEAKTHLELIDRIPDKVKPNPQPRVVRVTFQCECRTCEAILAVVSEPGNQYADCLDLEILAHEALEADGWVDGMCPRCVESSFGENVKGATTGNEREDHE